MNGKIKIFALLLGASAIVVQIIMLREFMAVFYGNELSVGIILAAWLIWVAVGSFYGNSILTKNGEKLQQQSVLKIHTITFISALFAIILIKLVRIVLFIPFGEYISFVDIVIYSIIGLALPCFSLGFHFSFLASLTVRSDENRGDPSAHIYVFESFGSVFASILFSLVLIKWMSNLTLLLLLVAIVFLALGLVNRQKYTLLTGGIVFILLFTPIVHTSESALLKIFWRSHGQNMKVIDWRHSRFGELAVIDWAGEKTLYKNGMKQTTLPDPIGTQPLAALIMTQHANAHNILLIGGGLGGLAPALARFPGTNVTYLELDEVEFNLALFHLTNKEAEDWKRENLRVVFVDGRHFLRGNSRRYDLIVINQGRPTSASTNRYYTEEFFHLAREHLNDEGILAIANFPSSAEYLADELLKMNVSLYHSLKQEFRNVLIIPGESALFFASQSQKFVTDTDILQKRFLDAHISFDYFFPQMFPQYFVPERLEYVNHAIKSSQIERLNRDFEPISYFYDFTIWNKLIRGHAGLFTRASRLDFMQVLGLVGIFSILWLFISLFLRHSNIIQQSGILLITFIIGFAGIVFDVLLILAFQTIFGYVYEWIGAALAAFMLGLAVSSWVVNRILDRINSKNVLAAILICVALFSWFLQYILNYLMGKPIFTIFFLIVLISGALVGSAFPILCDLYYRAKAERKVGSIYGADLTGGALGSLVVSGFLVPLFGFYHTLQLVSALVVFAILNLAVLKK